MTCIRCTKYVLKLSIASVLFHKKKKKIKYFSNLRKRMRMILLTWGNGILNIWILILQNVLLFFNSKKFKNVIRTSCDTANWRRLTRMKLHIINMEDGSAHQQALLLFFILFAVLLYWIIINTQIRQFAITLTL